MDSGSIATAAENAMPSLDSNDREAPSADNGHQDAPTSSHVPEAANVAAKAGDNGEIEENTSHSDAVSTGLNVTTAGDVGPSHDSNDGGAPSADGSHQELESVPIVIEPPPQSDESLPSQPSTKLDIRPTLEPGSEPVPEPASLGQATDLGPVPESDRAESPEPEEKDEIIKLYKVRLAQISSKNMEPSEIALNQALGQAIVDGKLEEFNRLLEQGAKIESRFDDEEDYGDSEQSTLFLAARYDWPKIAEKILALKSDKDFLEDTKTNGWAPAHIAAQNDSVDVLRQILEAGEKIGIKLDIVNSRNRDNNTPLILAARDDYLEMVKMLLDNGADLKIESTDEGTPLHSAAYHGSKKVFAHLLDVEGAKDLIGKQDDDGWTVLHCAARGGVEIASLLDDKSILSTLTKGPQFTALLVAAINGHKDTILSLLEAGSDIMAKTKDGRTVFHLAAESGFVDALEELAGKLDQETMTLKDDKGGTALCSAALEHGYDAVCFLMGHEAFALPRLQLGVSGKMNHRDIQEVKHFLLEYFDNKSESELDSLVHWNLIVHWAVFYGWESILKLCLNRQGDLCDSKTKSGETLLHVAACNGHAGVVEQLMDCFKKTGSTEANFMAKVSDKRNDDIIPLHFAAANDYVKTMRYLLEGSSTDEVVAESKNDKTLLYSSSWARILVESRSGETAFHFAARYGHESVVSFLFRWLEKYPDLQSTIRKQSADGKTPLSQAADNGHQSVAKTLLEVLTMHDFNKDAKVAWDELTEVARTGLEHYVELIVAKDLLLPNIPETNPHDLFPDQKWTGLLWAVYYGHYKVVWWLLRRNGPTILTSPIFEDATDMVDTLLTKLNNTAGLTSEEKSEKGQRYREIKNCLYSPPRVENVYDQYDPDGSPSVPQLSEKKEKVCEKYRATIVDFYNKAGHASFAALSRTMLETNYDIKRSLDEIMADAGMDHKEPRLLDRASGAGQPSRNMKSSPISPLNTDVPATEISVAGVPNMGAIDAEPSTRTPAIKPLASETPAAGTQKHAAATRQEQISKQKQVRDYGYKFRWIHIPANNMEWIEDLLSRSFSTNKEHRPVSNFVRRNRHELQSAYADSAGVYQFSRSMKPLCTRQPLKPDPQRNMGGKVDQSNRNAEVAARSEINTVVNTEQAKSPQEKDLGAEADSTSSGAQRIALYMPYLTFSKANVGDGVSVEGPDALIDAYGRDTIHELRTLDRYYYSSLPEADVQKRNKDQVLTKYITKKKKENKTDEQRVAHSVDQKHEKQRHWRQIKPKNKEKQPEENQHKNSKKEMGLILQVDQLWLWVIDGDKIITSSSYQTDGEPDIILKRVFKHLIEGRDHDRHPPSSPEQLMQLIVSSATGVIEQQKVILPEKGLSLSILEIFENAIGDVEDGELNLFQNFEETLDEDYSIDEEIGYLVLIKDILDELNILKSLVKDQKKVWHEAFSQYTTGIKSLEKDQKQVWHDAFSEYTMDKDHLNSREPGEILEMLEEMITDATRVERSINDLLDLKQKQANLSEAQSSRRQAEETAMQGTTLMVFTIVTIVFLPMSFLTALFALDITVFPHATDKLTYTPGWIFPMIFGPSAAMSIPAIYFAFHVDTALYIWNKLMAIPRSFWPTTKKKPQKKHDNAHGGEAPLKLQAIKSMDESELEKGGPNEEHRTNMMRRVRRVFK
ncbi:hypothetical protein V492_01836 [Pseudogymnoascus sp. VKM F-4246]|nr:hypothetical protein V492_01836 [Pseudogymnoascus sp. VKM F-4246]